MKNLYGTMVKILANLKSSCAKACYLIQKLESTIAAYGTLNL